jgi:hypothetical protein
MASEINAGVFYQCINGSYDSGLISRNFTLNQANIGDATNVTSVAAMAGTETLHGRNQKPSAKAATTTTLPACTYNNGAAGVGATLTGNSNGALATQDGVTLVVNQYLLVKDQASGLQNGLYCLTTVGDGSNPYVLTRVTAMDETGEFVRGSVYIESGSVNAARHYTCTNASAPTLGTTAITFLQSAAGTVLSQGNITTPGLMFVQNLDTANFVTFGPEIGGVLMPIGKIMAGKSELIALTPSLVVRAVADTLACKVDSRILEA